MNKAVKTVNAYIAAAPKEAQAKLRQLRKIVKSTAPGAEESISYAMPYYTYHGRLLYFAGYKSHIGFYGFPSLMVAHVRELTGYKTSKGTIQFPLDKPLPVTLIKRLIASRVKENKSKQKK